MLYVKADKYSWKQFGPCLCWCQVVILLGFVALQEDRILRSCAIKIAHPITKFLLLNILSLKIGSSWGKVVACGNQAILYKRGSRSQVKVCNYEYTFWILQLVVSYSLISPYWLERRSENAARAPFVSTGKASNDQEKCRFQRRQPEPKPINGVNRRPSQPTRTISFFMW